MSPTFADGLQSVMSSIDFAFSDEVPIQGKSHESAVTELVTYESFDSLVPCSQQGSWLLVQNAVWFWTLRRLPGPTGNFSDQWWAQSEPRLQRIWAQCQCDGSGIKPGWLLLVRIVVSHARVLEYDAHLSATRPMFAERDSIGATVR